MLKLTIKEVAKDLQIEDSRADSIVRSMKVVVKELNGYSLNDNYSLKLELIKEKGKYFVVAQRVSKRAEQYKKNKIIDTNIPKHLQEELSL